MTSRSKGPEGPPPVEPPGPPDGPAGFSEAPPHFELGAMDASLFDDKVELVRNFELIDSDEGRRDLLELSRRLAGLRSR
jgi:hypothetical protein